jgi:hypothetical protein
MINAYLIRCFWVMNIVGGVVSIICGCVCTLKMNESIY